LIPVSLEVGAKVKERYREIRLLAEKERDEEPPDSSIAILKRMDSLELRAFPNS